MDKKLIVRQVLRRILPDLRILDDDYYIIGSSAMLLCGIDVDNVEDIDILTSNKDAEKLKLIWKDKICKISDLKDSDRFRSNFSRYDFVDMNVEVMGELEVNNGSNWIPLYVKDSVDYYIEDLMVKVPSIEEQMQILDLFGREKDIIRKKYIAKYFSK